MNFAGHEASKNSQGKITLMRELHDISDAEGPSGGRGGQSPKNDIHHSHEFMLLALFLEPLQSQCE